MSGLMSMVRPVGLPWRPLKFRLLELAQSWSPTSLSGFMPRHMEQPAPRHSKPASRKISAMPIFSAIEATLWDPGTTIAFTLAATLRPLMCLATS